MIKRESEKTLLELYESFPVVTITGPRQSGKTTLVKSCFPEKPYVSLENPTTREFADNDPVGFLNQYPDGAILDEIQRAPVLLSYIQTIVDEIQENGLFVLTGSNQFEYINSIDQSLAGRTGILKLLPFSYHELYSDDLQRLDNVLYSGFYPRIHDQKMKPVNFHSSYISTYLERDVRQISKVHDLSLFQKFVGLCAGRTGQILNKSSLGNECGISNKTVEEWLSVLEASFVIYRLRPFYKNMNKRLVKSPKLYFYDTGLVCYLLRIEDVSQIVNHPLKGELFETFIISEFIKKRLHFGRSDNIYYFRESNGNEIDVIIDTGEGPIPIEIKSGQTVNQSMFKNLKYFSRIEKNTKGSGLIIGREGFEKRTGCLIGGYSSVYKLYDQLVSPY